MNIQNKKISELIPYENNPRINDKAVEYVKNSIAEFGFKVPIVIDKNNVIVCGHTRWKASKELGLKEISCIIADDLSDEQIKAFRKAQETGKAVELCCAIGDTEIDGKPYSEIVEQAREYISSIGGFEKFAEWGLF